jgi:hypothetical protein
MGLSIDHHALAGILLFGQTIDLLGGVYLAYDLFGGPHGPLRRLTQTITYVVFSLVVGIVGYLSLFLEITHFNPKIMQAFGQQALLGGMLGLGVGVGIGAGLGYALSVSYQRQYIPRPPSVRVRNAVFTGTEIGLFGCAFYFLAEVSSHQQLTFFQALVEGAAFNLINGYISASLVARLLVRRLKSDELTVVPSFDRDGFTGGMIAGALVGGIAGIGYWLTFSTDAWSAALFALAGALVAAVGGGYVLGVIQRVDWWVTTLPARRLGLFGAALIFVGFAIQSAQYLVPLFDITVR